MSVPSLRETFSTTHLRAVLEIQVRATSLRQVAAEVGISPTGLKKFLTGSQPYSKTRSKLVSWFVRFAAQQPDGLTADTAVAAVMVLTAGLPPEGRRQVVEDVVRSLEETYRAQGLARPRWLDALTDLLADEDPAAPGGESSREPLEAEPDTDSAPPSS